MTLTAVPMRKVLCHDLTLCGYNVLIINVTPGNVLVMSILSILFTWPPVQYSYMFKHPSKAQRRLVWSMEKKKWFKILGKVLQKHAPRIFLPIEFQPQQQLKTRRT